MKYTCNYCRSTNSSFQYKTYDTLHTPYHIRQCSDCRAYFLAPHPTPDQLSVAYQDDYYGEGESKFNPIVEKVVDFFRGRRAKAITKHLPQPSAQQEVRILDIGCGNGRFLDYLQRESPYIKGYGVELPGKQAQRAEKLLGDRLKIGPLQVDDFPTQHFHAITMVHVFEHLPNPKEILKIAHQLLKPGGILVLYLPNAGSFQANLFKGEWLHWDPPRHLFLFSPQDCVDQLSVAGFQLLKESHFNTEYNPFGFQQSILNRFSKDREVLYEYLKGNQPYMEGRSKWNLRLQDAFFKLSFPLFIGVDILSSTFRKGATYTMVFKKS